MVVALGVPSSGGPLRRGFLEGFLRSPLVSASSDNAPSSVPFFWKCWRLGLAGCSDDASRSASAESVRSSLAASRVRRGVAFKQLAKVEQLPAKISVPLRVALVVLSWSLHWMRHHALRFLRYMDHHWLLFGPSSPSRVDLFR